MGVGSDPAGALYEQRRVARIPPLQYQFNSTKHLGGAPGIHSARYIAGTDVDRVDALLTQLLEVPDGERTARFRCVLAVVTPAGQLHSAEGICEGLIARKPAGHGGFGYDPVFYLPEYGCTMAQLPEEEKNRISHRGRAVEAAAPMLRHLLDQ